jgi:hypothetical protein
MLTEITTLRNTVSKQQKELTETGALVKDFASLSLVHGFLAGQKPESFMIKTHNPGRHTVYMRLDRVPYPQTVRVQWNLALQPLDSYIIRRNIVMLNWATLQINYPRDERLFPM